MTTALEQLSGFVHRTRPGSLPARVRAAADRSLLDALANMAAGQDFGGLTGDPGHRPGQGQAGPDPGGVLGAVTGDGAGAEAFRLAVLAQVLDYSDGWRFGGNHPSSPVVAACVALAARSPASTLGQVRAAMAAGYEVGARLAAATHPEQTLGGLHPTGTTGAVAAAATTASLLGLDVAQTAAALSLAATYSPLSLIGGLYTGATGKALDAGYAARTGVEAALFARSGVTGWPGALDDPQGFVDRVTAGTRCGVAADDLTERHTITEVYLKPYPACRHTHSAIEAALLLREGGPVARTADIDAVEVHSYAVAARVVGRYTDVGSSYVACQLSLPYVVAAALHDGAFGPAQLAPESIRRASVQALAARVRLRVEPALDERYPAGNPATVVVLYADGSRVSRHVEVSAGDPRRPLDTGQILGKVPSTPAGKTVRAAATGLLDGPDDTRADTLPAIVASLLSTT